MSRSIEPALLSLALVLAACTASPSTTASQGAVPSPSTSAQASEAPSASVNAGELYAPLGYPGGGTIAFARYDPTIDDSAAYLIHPDGSGEHQLRVTMAWNGEPAELNGFSCCLVISPDGSQVAIAYDDTSGMFGDNGGLRKTQVLNLDGSRADSVPHSCGGCASIYGVDFTPRAWAPNGTLLAVSVVSDEDPTRMGLNLAPLDGSPGWSIQVTGAYDEFPITFSPDSRRLLFLRASQEGVGALMEGTLEPSTDGSGTFGLAVRQVSPAGWTVRQDDYIGPAASYSPDGSRIVFVADDGQGAQLYVVDAAGGTPESIAGPASGLTTAAWSPDGSWIAFDGSINGAAHDVYAVHPDGSGQVDLTAELGLGACCARWSPDSQALLVQATATDDQHAYLFIVAIHDGQTWQVTTVPSLYENVSWGPAPG